MQFWRLPSHFAIPISQTSRLHLATSQTVQLHLATSQFANWPLTLKCSWPVHKLGDFELWVKHLYQTLFFIRWFYTCYKKEYSSSCDFLFYFCRIFVVCCRTLQNILVWIKWPFFRMSFQNTDKLHRQVFVYFHCHFWDL